MYQIGLDANTVFPGVNPCNMHDVQKNLGVISISKFNKNVFHGGINFVLNDI